MGGIFFCKKEREKHHPSHKRPSIALDKLDWIFKCNKLLHIKRKLRVLHTCSLAFISNVKKKKKERETPRKVEDKERKTKGKPIASSFFPSEIQTCLIFWRAASRSAASLSRVFCFLRTDSGTVADIGEKTQTKEKVKRSGWGKWSRWRIIKMAIIWCQLCSGLKGCASPKKKKTLQINHLGWSNKKNQMTYFSFK